MSWEDHQADTFEKASTEGALSGPMRSRVDFVLHSVESGNKVLDVGSNHGSIAKLIAEQGNEVTCFDLPRVAAKGRELHKEMRWVAGSAEQRLPFENESFDVVVAGEVIEHILNLDKFLSEVKRVLRPEGKFVVTTPNVVRPVNVLQMLVGRNVRGFFHEEETPLHIRFYTIYTLMWLLKKHGFENMNFWGADSGNDVLPSGVLDKEDEEWLNKVLSKYRKGWVEFASILCCQAQKPR